MRLTWIDDMLVRLCYIHGLPNCTRLSCNKKKNKNGWTRYPRANSIYMEKEKKMKVTEQIMQVLAEQREGTSIQIQIFRDGSGQVCFMKPISHTDVDKSVSFSANSPKTVSGRVLDALDTLYTKLPKKVVAPERMF